MLPPTETYIPNARATVLGPSRLLTSGAHRPGRVADTGPAAATRTRTWPARPAPAVQAPAARLVGDTPMRVRAAGRVPVPMARLVSGIRMRVRAAGRVPALPG